MLKKKKGFLCFIITGTLASDWFQAHRWWWWVSYLCECGNSSYLTATRTLVESSSAIAAAAAVIFGCKDDWLTHDDDDLQNQENTCTPQGFDSSSCKRHRRYAKKNTTFFSFVRDGWATLQDLKRIFKYWIWFYHVPCNHRPNSRSY